MSYEALKHLHLLLVAASVLLFVARFGMKLQCEAMLQKKAIKILPHVIDTFLLISGVVIAVKLGFKPSEQPWLMSKLLLLVAYIVLGFIALKKPMTTTVRIGVAVAALFCVYAMANAAMTKQVLFGLF